MGTSFDTSRIIDDVKIDRPKYVFAFHGLGVRDYGYNPSLKKYDLLLLPGKKMVDNLKRLNIANSNNFAIIGYPKFDLYKKNQKFKYSLFKEKRKTILYNPHWNKNISSWYEWGKTILDFFQSLQNII